MTNPFDQFDIKSSITGGNPFDQFDINDLTQGNAKKGFIDKIKSSAHDRAGNYGKILESDEPALGKAYLALGQSAGLANDVTGHAMSAVTPEFLENALSKAGEYVLNTAGNLPSMGGGSIGERIPAELAGLEAQYPDGAQYARATANLGLLGTAAKFGGSPAVSTAATKTAQAAGELAKPAVAATGHALNKLNTRTIVPNSDEIKAAASAAYNRAEEMGGVLKPEFTNKFIDAVEGMRPQTDKGRMLDGDSVFTQMVERIGGYRGTPTSLREAQEIDEILGGQITALYRSGDMKQANRLMDVQSTLRNMIEDADDTMLQGTKEGFAALKDGRKLWATSKRLDEVERIIERASLTDNPATAIKTGFRNLSQNQKRMRGFNEDETKLIKEAANSGIVSDALRNMGSRLLPIVVAGSGGGLGATAATMAGTMAARGSATRAQVGRASAAARKVAERSGMVRTEKRLDPAKFAQIMRMAPREAQQAMREIDAEVVGAAPQRLLPAPETPKQLPAPQKDYVVDRAGNIHQASPQEQNRNITKRQRAESLGMSRDIYKVMDEYRARMGVEKTKQLMDKYGMTKLGKFVARNPDLRMVELDEATLRKMLDDIE